MLIVRNLEARGIRYAKSDYWIAYYVTFMTGERTIVEPSDSPRVLEYGREVEAHKDEAVRISRAPCGGGTQMFEGAYLCPPE